MEIDKELRGWKAHCVYLQDKCERLELENSRLKAAIFDAQKALDGEIKFCEMMRAQVAELQSVIDAANAQEPVARINGAWELRWAGSGQIVHIVEKHDLKIGDKLYKRPIPAQQSVEQAHMAGQSDAGVDPSYSNAHAYAISTQQSQSVAAPEDVPADCLSPTVSRSRRYGDAESLINKLNEAKNG